MNRNMLSCLPLFTLLMLPALVMASIDPRDVPADVPTRLEFEEKYEWTALHWAVRRGQVENVRNLINREDIEARDFQGRTPLHIAVLSGHDALVELLLRNGANVNARDQWEVTPLRRAELVSEIRGWDRAQIKAILKEHGGISDQIKPSRDIFADEDIDYVPDADLDPIK